MTSTLQPTLSRRAPAKVNLTLAVRGRRADGYHEIESWMIAAGLFDRLDFHAQPIDADGAAALTRSAGIGGLALSVSGGGVPTDERNLVWKAARLLAEAAGIAPTGRVALVKEIPVEAGLGGGSSDAAAALIGLNRLWGIDWEMARLKTLAEKIGSDVPFFLNGTSAVVAGRGERLKPTADFWRGWLVVVVPPFGLPTARVYERWAEREHRTAGPVFEWSWTKLGASALSERLFNDLEPAAFACEPRLEELHRRLDGLAGRRVRMTGSGSALFALFDSHEEAEAWRAEAAARAPEARVLAAATL